MTIHCSNCGHDLVVVVPALKKLIQPSDFEKKDLAEDHLDLVQRCEFGCPYCSTDRNRWQSLHAKQFAALIEEQLGSERRGCDHGKPLLVFPDVVAQLDAELAHVRPTKGAGRTLVLSQLTDPLSPWLVENNITLRALELVLARTSYTIRVLTKSAPVATPPFVDLFVRHRERFVVGLSIGSLDNAWAKRMEWRTPGPTARVGALRHLQDAGIRTYGMACPTFPHVLATDEFERLLDAIRPELCEHVWCEPYNARSNWQPVRDAYPSGSPYRTWFDAAFGPGNDNTLWSRYATDLYARLRAAGERGGWAHKIRFLLYEGRIAPADAATFATGIADGTVLLQTAPSDRGCSSNPAIAEQQQLIQLGRRPRLLNASAAR